MKRPWKIIHGHPLASRGGQVRVSRAVLYEKLSGIAGNCNWCGCALTWKTLCADHLDSNTENNVPENIVGSCRGCNANREDGTGRGRKKGKKCVGCGEVFIGGKHHHRQLHCSATCAYLHKKKRPRKVAHGTRSYYTGSGCRCSECKDANSRYNRIYEKTRRKKRNRSLQIITK